MGNLTAKIFFWYLHYIFFLFPTKVHVAGNQSFDCHTRVAEGNPQPPAPSDSCDQARHLLSLNAFNIFQAGSLCVHGT